MTSRNGWLLVQALIWIGCSTSGLSGRTAVPYCTDKSPPPPHEPDAPPGPPSYTNERGITYIRVGRTRYAPEPSRPLCPSRAQVAEGIRRARGPSRLLRLIQRCPWDATAGIPAPSDVGAIVDTSARLASFQPIHRRVAQVTIEYEHACSSPTFELCWDGMVLESYPAQVPLTLLRARGSGDCGHSGMVTDYFDLDYLNRTLAGNSNFDVAGALLDFPPLVSH